MKGSDFELVQGTVCHKKVMDTERSIHTQGWNVQGWSREYGDRRGSKEGCVALDESENLEAPPNSKMYVVFEREGGW